MISFSPYLTKKKPLFQKLVSRLQQYYPYCSLLCSDSKGLQVLVGTHVTNVSDSMWKERGFVVRIYQNGTYSEFSFNEIQEETLDDLVAQIRNQLQLDSELVSSKNIQMKSLPIIEEETIKRHFERVKDQKILTVNEWVDRLQGIKLKCSHEPPVVNINMRVEFVTINKLFLSPQRDLEQVYTWTNASIMAVVNRNQTIRYGYQGFSGVDQVNVLKELEDKAMNTIHLAVDLLDAKPPVAGEYDVITSPEITGLIAHEAFGHGVEMDMFVKNRAKAVEYIDKPVASPLVIMHEGALGPENVSSYFFDDEGTLAHDTIIIDHGILKTGISDVLSGLQLQTHSTGNGKRQAYDHKAYVRMTNTYFESGKDSLEKMIASISHGYLLSTLMSGMEDPKNWGIQCVALCGHEIKEGKLTGNLISPVIMTGYVPDLLQSISMVSKDFEIDGCGYCGKGHKEFVKTANGGPYLKARVKIS